MRLQFPTPQPAGREARWQCRHGRLPKPHRHEEGRQSECGAAVSSHMSVVQRRKAGKQSKQEPGGQSGKSSEIGEQGVSPPKRASKTVRERNSKARNASGDQRKNAFPKELNRRGLSLILVFHSTKGSLSLGSSGF